MNNCSGRGDCVTLNGVKTCFCGDLFHGEDCSEEASEFLVARIQDDLTVGGATIVDNGKVYWTIMFCASILASLAVTAAD